MGTSLQARGALLAPMSMFPLMQRAHRVPFVFSPPSPSAALRQQQHLGTFPLQRYHNANPTRLVKLTHGSDGRWQLTTIVAHDAKSLGMRCTCIPSIVTTQLVSCVSHLHRSLSLAESLPAAMFVFCSLLSSSVPLISNVLFAFPFFLSCSLGQHNSLL
jgi:hypothetical protein